MYCSAVCDPWSIFSRCFEPSTSWCFGSHFFVARSHRFRHCHLPLSFSGFFFCVFFFLRKSMERKLLCQLFTATNCSTLARHALKFARLLSIQFCSSRYWAMRVSCLDVTEVTWPKRGIFSCRQRSCSKHYVCFHSNQYFYVPQENVNVSNEQRVC